MALWRGASKNSGALRIDVVYPERNTKLKGVCHGKFTMD
jgi:hypothetical protein